MTRARKETYKELKQNNSLTLGQVTLFQPFKCKQSCCCTILLQGCKLNHTEHVHYAWSMVMLSKWQLLLWLIYVKVPWVTLGSGNPPWALSAEPWVSQQRMLSPDHSLSRPPLRAVSVGSNLEGKSLVSLQGKKQVCIKEVDSPISGFLGSEANPVCTVFT